MERSKEVYRVEFTPGTPDVERLIEALKRDEESRLSLRDRLNSMGHVLDVLRQEYARPGAVVAGESGPGRKRIVRAVVWYATKDETSTEFYQEVKDTERAIQDDWRAYVEMLEEQNRELKSALNNRA